MSVPRFRAPRFVLPDVEPDVRGGGGPDGGAGSGAAGLQVSPAGRLSMVADGASVRQALLLLLSTRPGERAGRPAYGCHLFRLAFAPADDTTAGLAIHYVTRAVEVWEPRVEVVGVDAERPDDAPWLLEVLMRYRVRATQRDDELAVAVPLDPALGVHGERPRPRPRRP